MEGKGNVVLRDVVTVRVIKIGWRYVILETQIGNEPAIERRYRKGDAYKGHVHIGLTT